MLQRFVWASVIAALGCSGERKADGSPAQPVEVRSEPAPRVADAPSAIDPPPAKGSEVVSAAIPERVACEDDGDCMNSCSQGAVSMKWWRRVFPGDEGCEGGCADADAAPPRCEADRCVAYDLAGARRADCIDRVEVPVAAVGPAHTCDQDSDCISSCSLGAVNKRWLEARGVADCRGGCTAVGFQPPRCENNLCVAYRDTGDKTVRVDECTRKSIWE